MLPKRLTLHIVNNEQNVEQLKKITPVRAVVFPLQFVFLFALCLSTHIAKNTVFYPQCLPLTQTFLKVYILHTRGQQGVGLKEDSAHAQAATGCLLRREVVDKTVIIEKYSFNTESQKRKNAIHTDFVLKRIFSDGQQ